MGVDSSPGKTPVSLLQEICTRKNINPKYELLQVEGAVHEPTFQYRLSLEYNGTEFEQTGTGRSKKEAKHNTALSMLVAMGLMPKDAAQKERQDAETLQQEQRDVSGSLDCDGGNPVGLLQELCMKMKHPPPTYEVYSEEGLPHERIFAMACRVGEHYVEIGRGKSKKLAKRQAAALMAERLRNIPSETTNVFHSEEDDDKIFERITAIGNKQREERNGGGSNGGSPNSGSCSMLFKCQKIAKNKFSHIYDYVHPIEDPVQFLENLEETSFRVIYIDFDEVSSEGNYQCFVQVTSDPPMVAIGEGATRQDAKISAAHDVLNIFMQLLEST